MKGEFGKLIAPLAAENFIKDPYVLEFLNLKNYPALREFDLERALINKLQEFLLELGRGFCFMARQKLIAMKMKIFILTLCFAMHLEMPCPNQPGDWKIDTWQPKMTIPLLVLSLY